MEINTYAAGRSASAGSASSGEIARLQEKLKVLFRRVSDLAQNQGIDPKLKIIMQQSLQAQIEMVMKQISDLQTKKSEQAQAMQDVTEQHDKKKTAPRRSSHAGIDILV